MFGLGSLIGGAMKIGGSIFGGNKASKIMNNIEKSYGQQLVDNARWYDQRYNEDATQRADAQRVLAMTNEAIRNRNRQSAAESSIRGGTNEKRAIDNMANAEEQANAAAQIAIAGANRKDEIENQYMAKKDAINDKINNLKMKKAENIINAVNGVSSAAADIAGNSGLNDYNVLDWFKKKNQGTTDA